MATPEKKAKRITFEYEKSKDIVWITPVIAFGIDTEEEHFGLAVVWFRMMFHIKCSYGK